MFSIWRQTRQLRRPSHGRTLPRWKDTGIGEKGYATTGRAQRRNFPDNLRRLTLSRIRMEYRSFDGTVTMLLMVVAPETPGDDRWILRRPPNLT